MVYRRARYKANARSLRSRDMDYFPDIHETEWMVIEAQDETLDAYETAQALAQECGA